MPTKLSQLSPADVDALSTVGMAKKTRVPIVAAVAEQPTWDVNAANNDAAFASACQAAFNAGGGAVLLPPLLKIAAEAVVPHSVDIVGLGALPSAFAASEILCTAAGSGVRFGKDTAVNGVVGSGGGKSGGFYINGNNVALNPMRCAVGTRTYENIEISGAAQDGLILAATQNSLFSLVNVNASARDNFVFDMGAAGNHFLKPESSNAGRYNIDFRATAVGASAIAYTAENVIDNMIMEYTTANAGPMVNHGAGVSNQLSNCQLAASSGLTTMAVPSMIRVAQDYTVSGALQPSQLIVDAVTITGVAVYANLRVFDVQAGANLYVSGWNTVVAAGILFKVAATGNVWEQGEINFGGATRYELNEQNVRRQFHSRVQTNRPAGSVALQILQDGDVVSRYNLLADGRTEYSSGAAASDTNWRRKAAGCIGSDFAIGASAVTTAGRPSAATVGAGAQVWDSTLGKPIWSNGAVWKDAAGVTV